MPIKTQVDVILVSKLKKWRLKLESAKVYDIKSLSNKEITTLKSELGEKYFDILFTSKGMTERFLSELSLISKQTTYLHEKLDTLMLSYLQLYLTKWVRLRSQLLVSFQLYEKKRMQKVYGDHCTEQVKHNASRFHKDIILLNDTIVKHKLENQT